MKCPICTQDESRGYRRIVNGEIIEQCRHDCHVKHFIKPSNAWSFYLKYSPKKLRGKNDR